MEMSLGQTMLSLSMGIALAATAGLRAFLPLLAVGIAGRLGWVPLSESFAWLSSWPALLALGTAAILEFIADKIPFVDHALHGLGMVAAPTAGTLLVASSLPSVDPVMATIVGIVAGGGSAGIVHGARAALRPASTASTGGLGNTAFSLGEDALAIGGIVAAFVVPIIAALIAITFVVGCFLLARFLWKKYRRGSPRDKAPVDSSSRAQDVSSLQAGLVASRPPTNNDTQVGSRLFCTGCGRELRREHRFCSSCGAATAQADEETREISHAGQ